MSRDDPQTNVRLPPYRYEILETAAFVRGIAPRKLVQELIDEAIDRYTKSAPVKKALEARRDHAAEEERKLSHLSTRRSGRGRERS